MKYFKIVYDKSAAIIIKIYFYKLKVFLLYS